MKNKRTIGQEPAAQWDDYKSNFIPSFDIFEVENDAKTNAARRRLLAL